MKRTIIFSAIALLLINSCASNADFEFYATQEPLPPLEISRPFEVIDFMHRDEGREMPEWVISWFEGGEAAIEKTDSLTGNHVFVSRLHGTNFNALNQWVQWFDAELDFPRLAAARIEARFLSGVSHPDVVFGDFFIALIRGASNAHWFGAVVQDYFWIHRQFSPPEDEFFIGAENFGFVEEDWEFLILVTIDREIFADQLYEVFRNVRPNPQPNRQQIAAVNNVVERFFDGF